MKLYIPKLNKEGIGGGNSFVNNFRSKTKYELTDIIEGAGAMFVPNPMWAERSDFEEAKRLEIPTILRLDNIPEDWNNRGTSIPKLRDFTKWATKLIFQSEWARQKYLEFGTKDGTVIHNGVDTNLFTLNGDSITSKEHPIILFVKSSRNENKRYPEVMEIFRRYWQKNKNAKLLLVGQFADDYHKYDFGFYNGENYQYLGMHDHNSMAMIYRSADVFLFPAYADCASNCVLEAMASGTVPIIHPYGGQIEFFDNEIGGEYGILLTDFETDYKAMIDAALKVDRLEMRKHIEDNFNIDLMVKNYEEIIDGESL